MLPFSFISFTFLQGVISSAEVCVLLLKGLQKLPKKSKPFVHKLKFVIHIVICDIIGKLWWFCKSKEGGKRCCQWISAPLHRYQPVPYNTAELCPQHFWDHLPSCTARNAGHLLILQTVGQSESLASDPFKFSLQCSSSLFCSFCTEIPAFHKQSCKEALEKDVGQSTKLQNRNCIVYSFFWCILSILHLFYWL